MFYNYLLRVNAYEFSVLEVDQSKGPIKLHLAQLVNSVNCSPIIYFAGTEL